MLNQTATLKYSDIQATSFCSANLIPPRGPQQGENNAYRGEAINRGLHGLLQMEYVFKRVCA